MDLKPVTTRLPADAMKKLKVIALQRGMKVEAVMREAVELWLKKNAKAA